MNKPSVCRNSLRNPKGLSLLETLAAIVILGIALISISYFFSQARANIETFGRMRCGLALTQDKMEELKDLSYFDYDLDIGTHSDRVNSSGDSAADGQFFRQWEVTAVADAANGTAEAMDYKLVDLKIYDQWLRPDSSVLDDPEKLVAQLKAYISP